MMQWKRFSGGDAWGCVDVPVRDACLSKASPSRLSSFVFLCLLQSECSEGLFESPDYQAPSMKDISYLVFLWLTKLATLEGFHDEDARREETIGQKYCDGIKILQIQS
jgi:hypothetical protein